MRLLLVALVVALVVGIARGGRIRGLAVVPLPLLPLALLWVGVGLTLAAGSFDDQTRRAILVYNFVAGAVFSLALARRLAPRSLARRGGWLLVLGCTLNALVIGANAGMPVDPGALARVGIPAQLDVTEGEFYRHVPLDETTHLAPLADVIPVVGLDVVVSAGDVALAAGAALLVVGAMGGRATRTRSQHDEPAAL